MDDIRRAMAISIGTPDQRTIRHRNLGFNSKPINIERTAVDTIRRAMTISIGQPDQRTIRHRKLGSNSTPINIERTSLPSTRNKKNRKLEMHPTRRNNRRNAAYKMQSMGVRPLTK